MKKLLLVFALGALLTSPALAIDLTQPLKTFDGNDFVGQDGKVIGLTAGLVVENALLNEPAQTPDDKNANFWLALKVHKNAKEFDPSPEEAVRIKKALAATQPTAIYGAVASIIDPKFLAGH